MAVTLKELKVQILRQNLALQKMAEALQQIADSADNATTGDGHAKCAQIAKEVLDEMRAE